MTGRTIARIAANAAILVAVVVFAGTAGAGAVGARMSAGAPVTAESGSAGTPVAVRLSALPTAGNRFEYGVDVVSTADQPVDVTVTLVLPAGAGAVPSTAAATTPAAGPSTGPKPAAGAPAGQKPAGPNAATGATAGPKPAAPKAGGAPAGPKPAGPNAATGASAAPKPAGPKPAGPDAASAAPAAPKPAGPKPAGPGAVAGASTGPRPAGPKPAGPGAAGAFPAAPQAAGSKPAGGPPAAGQPVLGLPIGGQPATGRPSASQPGGSRSLAWQARVAPRGSVTVRTGAVLAGAADRSVSTACVADRSSGRVLDCAATVYAAPPAPPAPWWRTWGLLGLAGCLAVAAAVFGVRWLRRDPQRLEWLTRVSPVERLRSLARAVRKVVTRPKRRRNDGYGWPAAGLAILALVALAVAAAIAIVPRVQGVAGQGSSSDHGGEGHGWVGPQRTLQIGSPASDDVVEFEVYRMGCAGQGAKTCVVTLAARNLTGVEQPWYSALQRLHVSGTTWVNPDPAATAAANGGVDVFATPLRPAERLVAVLAFVVPPGGVPARLELREGAFARGVVLDVQS